MIDNITFSKNEPKKLKSYVIERYCSNCFLGGDFTNDTIQNICDYCIDFSKWKPIKPVKRVLNKKPSTGFMDANPKGYKNPTSTTVFASTKCELICDHNPVWAGDGYYCSKCDLEFIPVKK